MRILACIAKTLTAGQRAAVRAAIARRGELELTQKQLAQAAGISERALQNFEAYKSWPNPMTLSQLERLGLGWASGHLAELAAQHDEAAEAQPDDLSAQVMELETLTEEIAADLRAGKHARARPKMQRAQEILDQWAEPPTPEQPPDVEERQRAGG